MLRILKPYRSINKEKIDSWLSNQKYLKYYAEKILLNNYENDGYFSNKNPKNRDFFLKIRPFLFLINLIFSPVHLILLSLIFHVMLTNKIGWPYQFSAILESTFGFQVIESLSHYTMDLNYPMKFRRNMKMEYLSPCFTLPSSSFAQNYWSLELCHQPTTRLDAL